MPLDSKVWPNGARITQLREARGWSQETLADNAVCSKKSVENAEKRMEREILKSIADALGSDLASISIEPPPSVPAKPGNPEFYLRAIVIEEWLATCREYPGYDSVGNPLPAREFEYTVKFQRAGMTGMTLEGSCECLTEPYAHQRFRMLGGTVDGLGFVSIDGYRDSDEGANHFFRAMLKFDSDGRRKSMNGGYVVYEVEDKAIFVGLLHLTPITRSS